MRRFFSVALLALLVPAGGHAARPGPGEIVLAGCRQGECGWYRVVRVEPARSFRQGVLRRMIVRGGTSVHLDGRLPESPRQARIEWAPAESERLAFCSTRRPAYAFQSGDGGFIVHFLDLFSLAGYQEGSGRAYMRMCHGRDRVPGATGLRRLGYRPGARSEQVEDATAETMTRF